MFIGQSKKKADNLWRFCRNEVVGIQTGWRKRFFEKSRKGMASDGLSGADGVEAGFNCGG